ncbi:hypothetical protein UlMin_023268 [Ulmus minor]
MNAQRALLDELMGSARNLTEEERKGYKEITWSDKELCGAYMIHFCPHDLFINTRSDLGPCPRIDFEKSPRHDAYVPKFEAELAQFCEKLVMNLDRRVRHGRERLSQEVEPTPPPPLSAKKFEQLSVLKEKIKNLLEQVDALNAKKAFLTQQFWNDRVLMLAQEKKMAFCEICGSFLEKAREEERLAKEKEAEKWRKQREKEHESRRRSSSSDRERYRNRDRERDRDRYRERDYNRWYGIYIFNT